MAEEVATEQNPDEVKDASAEIMSAQQKLLEEAGLAGSVMAEPEIPEPPAIPEHLLEGERRPPTSMLMRLLDGRTSKRVLDIPPQDLGIAEHLPYPFMALVGQVEMRTALLLAVVNPNVGGVLLVGPRGTGKTTAARGLSGLLPFARISTCVYGCMPEDYQVAGLKGVCAECAEKLEAGESIVREEPVQFVELPLNARLEDVVGGINERIALQYQRVRLERGILSRADQNILYVDEVNLLNDQIVDAILDAAAQGHYTVNRGPMAATYRSRFVLIGSMNPEEGHLRPQIQDRFGLRVLVGGLESIEERMRVYDRVRQFRLNPRAFIQAFDDESLYAQVDIIEARAHLPHVTIGEEAKNLGLRLVQEMQIHSHRAEFTMFEAARAMTALDRRSEVTAEDIQVVAPMALRMRGSEYLDTFFATQETEDQRIEEIMTRISGDQS
jgi:magnesium chelatase subunit I